MRTRTSALIRALVAWLAQSRGSALLAFVGLAIGVILSVAGRVALDVAAVAIVVAGTFGPSTRRIYVLIVKWSHRGRPKVVAWPAGRLARVAAWLLPPSDCARYAEEFHGELQSLAEAGAGRWRQLGYAMRLLVRAPALRVELKAARRRSASP